MNRLKDMFFDFILLLPPKKMPYLLPFTKKYFKFALSLIINLLDHLQFWCRLNGSVFVKSWTILDSKQFGIVNIIQKAITQNIKYV